MTTRYSKAEAAEIDVARGDVSASEWIRAVTLAAARAGQPPPIRLIEVESRTILRAKRSSACPHRLPPGTYCKDCGRTKA